MSAAFISSRILSFQVIVALGIAYHPYDGVNGVGHDLAITVCLPMQSIYTECALY
jgi:hypothetical protein